MLFLDLDRFKVVNDNAGPRGRSRSGSLVEVSNRLPGASLRASGDTVARLGRRRVRARAGGRRPTLRPPTALADAHRGEVAKPLNFERREIFITASIGIALSSAPQSDARGDSRATPTSPCTTRKAKGKARHEIFDDGMSAPALDRMDLEMDLRSAISRHGVPALTTSRSCGSTRAGSRRSRRSSGWQHEKRGLLKPAVHPVWPRRPGSSFP